MSRTSSKTSTTPVAPGIGALVAGPHLIDGPGALPDPVATGVVEVFDDVLDAHSKPDPLVTGLLGDLETAVVVSLREGLVGEADGVSSRPFKSLADKPFVIDFNVGSMVLLTVHLFFGNSLLSDEFPQPVDAFGHFTHSLPR